jgi:hypothetical protein
MAFGWGVADGTTNALQTCTTTCFKGIAGSGAGQLDRPLRIAVDNTGGPSQGDLYVIDRSFHVQKFKPTGEFLNAFSEKGKGKCQINPLNAGLTNDPIAVGPGGIVYVADSRFVGATESEGFVGRIEKFDEFGVCLEEMVLYEGGTTSLVGLAVDSSEDIYVTDIGTGRGIRKFSASGVEYGAPYPLDPALEVRALGLDGEDNLSAGQLESTPVGALRVIAEYDESGNTLRRFGYGVIQFRLWGIAPFHTTVGDVFGIEEKVGSETEGNKVRYLAFPPPGPIVPSSTLKANPVGNTKATLGALINPEGKATTFHFDYVDQAGFEASGFSGAKSTPESASIGSDFRLHLAKAEIGCPKPQDPPQASCLTPDTTYHFRVIATNAEGKAEAQGTFTTQPPLRIEATYATEVGTDTATLHGEVNPLGIPATGHFQYVDEATYEADVEAQGAGHGFDHATDVPNVGGGEGAIDFGEGEVPVVRGATISLDPATTYRYRLIAENPFATVVGPERTLRTFAPLAPGQDGPCANEPLRLGPAPFLPDCRGYEMVTPLDKNNGDAVPSIETFTELPAALNQSSLSGDKLTYSTARAFGDALSAPFAPQYIASRDPGAGWLTHAIVPPRGAAVLLPGIQTDTEFKAFSPDLCEGWLRTVAEPVLAEGAIAGFPNLYRRHDSQCGGPTSFEALTTVQPTHELTEYLFPAQHYSSLELQGVSADGQEALYVVLESLESSPPAAPQPPACLADLKDFDACTTRLYLTSPDGALHHVCVLPSGEVNKTSCVAGWPNDNTGSTRENRVQNAISEDGSRVFWTSFTGSVAVQAGKIYMRENPAAEGPECEGPGTACTIAVSKDAEALSGTATSRYWTAAQDGSAAIFTTGEDPGAGEDLYRFDVESKATQLIAHKVSGVMGASEDATDVYFTSPENLAEGATAGEQNLYLYHGGSLRFAAALAEGDIPGPKGHDFSLVAPEPRRHVARVSADGLHAAFMSRGRPTGYDNTDAANGKAAAEVYLYDASADEGEGKLICASCNPSGARPVGANFAFKPGDEYWAAAQIPFPQNTLYPGRELADDGSRLYFASSDMLSPRDTNGRQDVYQWEREGAGGCDREDPSFVPSSAGCLALISSGQSPLESEFVDASPNGDDVFFSTLSSLVSQDYGLVDIYDARVGGGFPEPPNSPAPCEGEACQSPPEAPNDPTPASSAFQGSGNVVEDKPASCRKPKVRRRGRCVAKKHRKPAHKGKRANHNGRAGR